MGNERSDGRAEDRILSPLLHRCGRTVVHEGGGADVLQSQSLQMRMLRQQRVREHINRLPGKMVIPMALLIFPAILAVILVPIIPVIMNAFK